MTDAKGIAGKLLEAIKLIVSKQLVERDNRIKDLETKCADLQRRTEERFARHQSHLGALETKVQKLERK